MVKAMTGKTLARPRLNQQKSEQGPGQPGHKNKTLSKKITKAKRIRGMIQG
jgi:hypothetical protein